MLANMWYIPSSACTTGPPHVETLLPALAGSHLPGVSGGSAVGW